MIHRRDSPEHGKGVGGRWFGAFVEGREALWCIVFCILGSTLEVSVVISVLNEFTISPWWGWSDGMGTEMRVAWCLSVIRALRSPFITEDVVVFNYGYTRSVVWCIVSG